MIFAEGKVYAKVWKVTPSENKKYIDLQITTSEKDSDDNYINSSWFPRCIGKAVNTLKNVKRGDKIIMTRFKFTNERKEQDDGSYKSFFRFLILDAEIDGVNNDEENQETSTPSSAKAKGKAKNTKKPEEQPSEESESDCPW